MPHPVFTELNFTNPNHLHLPVRFHPKNQFSSEALLAPLILGSGEPADHSTKAAGLPLRSLFQSLSSEKKKQISKKLGNRFLEELFSLSHEADSELFFAGMLELGGRLQDAGKIEAAVEVYSALVAAGNSPQPPLILRGGEQRDADLLTSGEVRKVVPPLRIRGGQEGLPPVPALTRERAQTRLNAILGVGAVGPRVGFLLDRFSEEATAPETIIPMIAGSAVYQLAKTYQLGKYAAMAEATWYNRKWGARLTASAFGMMLEIPTFALGGRYLARAMGKPVSADGEADLFRAGLSLLAFKGAAFASNQVFLRFNGFPELAVPRLQGIAKAGECLMSQATLFGGLWLAHHLEVWANLRQEVDGATNITDSLGSMVSLQVGSHLGERALGAGFLKFQRELGLKTELYFQAEEVAWKEALKDFGGEALEYWKHRPALPLLMVFPPGGKKGGEGADPQIMARVQAQIRAKIVDTWRQGKFLLGKTPSGSSTLKLDLNFDRGTGFLLSNSEIVERQVQAPGSIMTARVRADIVKNIIIIPDQSLKAFQEHLLEFNPNSVEVSIMQGLIELNGRPIGDLERLRRIKEDETLPGVPIFIEETKPKKRGRDADATLPLFLGTAPVLPKSFELDAEGMRVILEKLTREVWQTTPLVDRPPLLYFVDPPALVGAISLDGKGQMVGSSLGRPAFSGDGGKITSPKFPEGGTPVSVLFSEAGDLLTYHAEKELNPVQRKMLKTLETLPKNFKGQQKFLLEYPYAWEMIQGSGLGRLLLNLNEALATGRKPDESFLQRLFLLPQGQEYQWVPHRPSFGRKILPQSVAVIDAGINPLPRVIQGRQPRFLYNLRWGQLPPEVKALLDYVKERVKKTE